MNSYDLTYRLRKARRRISLTATEQALYYELVAICNEEEWADVFNCSNDELSNALNITEKTLINSRNTLIQAGLIWYKSGKSKRQFGKYSLQTTVIDTANTTVNPTANVTANEVANPTVNPSDYIKTKTETKQNNKIQSVTSEFFPFDEDEVQEEKKQNPVKPPNPPKEEKEKSSAKKEKEVIDYFHEVCKRLPKVQIINQQRKKSINARINDYGIEKVKEVLEIAGKSNFMSGENRSLWTADFDWIMKPTNFVKILEGNYNNKDQSNGQSTYQNSNKGIINGGNASDKINGRSNPFTVEDFIEPSTNL